MYPPREGNGLWDQQQVISQPELHSIELTEEDNFLIMACDGVWDVLSNQEAVSYVHRRLLTHRDVQRAAVELIDKVLLLASLMCWVALGNTDVPLVQSHTSSHAGVKAAA